MKKFKKLFGDVRISSSRGSRSGSYYGILKEFEDNNILTREEV